MGVVDHFPGVKCFWGISYKIGKEVKREFTEREKEVKRSDGEARSIQNSAKERRKL
jgi:hypothetical protein